MNGWIKRISKSVCVMVSMLYLLASYDISFLQRVMFVSSALLYMAFSGVDAYFEKKRCGLYIAGVFLMIMNSFYFSIGGMLSLAIYGMHRYILRQEI